MRWGMWAGGLVVLVLAFVAGVGFGVQESTPLQDLYHRLRPGSLPLNLSGLASHQADQAFFDALPARQHCVVLLGDSETAFLGEHLAAQYAAGMVTPWTPLLADHCLLNRGIQGDTTLGVLDRLPGIVALHPRKLFLMVGINDLTADSSIRALAGRYQLIVSELRRDLPTTTLYLESLLPTGHAISPARIREVNADIRRIAATSHATYIDVYTPLADAHGYLPARDTYDGIHLLPPGEAVWSKLLARYAL